MMLQTAHCVFCCSGNGYFVSGLNWVGSSELDRRLPISELESTRLTTLQVEIQKWQAALRVGLLGMLEDT